MSTGTRSALWATSGDVAWRAWCDAVYNVLIDAGWVLTSDTGQRSNPAADTYPLANTFTYWVFRFSDAAQATSPIYMKFEIARGTGTTNARFQVTVGTGTNGAGTITGQLIQAVSIGTASWIPSTVDNTTFMACMANGAAWFSVSEDVAFFFWVGRSMDSAGAPTNESIAACAQAAPGTSMTSTAAWTRNARSIPNVGQQLSGLYQCPAMLVAGQRLGANGLSPIYPIIQRTDAGKFQYAGAYGCSKTDFGANALQTINQFGTGSHYFVMPTATSGNYPRGADARLQSLAGLMLIWE